ncbi:MAG: cryptochrome/photolyase family protein [Guyparkeria sp.]|uniref:cryptochrome/photolyase family protein n=1 Tax=Guyparkeria sp. TaxID=2035736 RepID=UPI00397D9995
MTESPVRHLLVVLGDQLDPKSALFERGDPSRDVIWMAEVVGEATHVWSQQSRIAVFLSAMRHFAAHRREEGWRVDYRELPVRAEDDDLSTLEAALTEAIARWRPGRVIVVCPGEYRLRHGLAEAVEQAGVAFEERPDRHFMVEESWFADWAEGRKSLRMEHFYRAQRRRFDVLMDGRNPVGGKFNFDASNRRSFDARGPGLVPEPARFSPDRITRQVLDLVAERFADHPGGEQRALANFDWPVTPDQAEQALQDFLDQRAAGFGDYQDAMWTDAPWLYHSRLSVALNLKLIDPRRVIEVVETACRDGRMPLAAAEGFIRQVLGWREFVRGLYWWAMPEYAERNALGADQPLPSFYWQGRMADGEPIPMTCLDQVLGQTLSLGYAHHIQRLMVTGLFAQLLGVRPQAVHEWYLAIYVDAVEWVELPNVIGMSQYADGGMMASKPYVATGRYIERMSNYCAHCRFDPGEATGETACPFTTLYWDFLLRHGDRFAAHPRTALQWKHVERIDTGRADAIRARAGEWRAALVQSGGYSGPG